MSQSSDLLKVGDVAKRLGLTKWAVYDLVNKDVLPVVRLGRTVRFSPAALDLFIQNGGKGT